MKVLKNLIIGFAISFLGSLPLGYLNIIGYTIYGNYGLDSLIQFLLGIITIEFFVIYIALIFAEKIANNKKLLKTITLLSIIFLLILTIFAAIQIIQTEDTETNITYVNSSFFLNGMFLNCLNLMQIPFWAGWSIYLLSNKLISTKKYNKIFYLTGTLVGTVLGMSTFILALHKLAENISIFQSSINYILFLCFLVLLLLQVFKYYKKYINNQ